MRRARAGAALLVLAIGGCRPAGSGSAPVAERVVRDSAGVRIVDDRAATWAPGKAWTVDSQLIDLGAPDGAFHGFANPVGMTRLDDGRIVVADAGLDQLCYFAADGHFLYTVGGPGRAAGQFRSLWGVFAGAADSVVAFDIESDRATTFDPNGALVDTLGLPVPVGSNGYLPLGRSSDGALTLLRNETPVPFPGRPWSVAVDTGVVVRFAASGAPIDSIGPLAVAELLGMPVPQAGGGTVTIPIARPLGRKAAFVVRGDTVSVAAGATPAIDQYVNGRMVRSIRLPGDLTVVPESLIAEFKRRRRSIVAGAGLIDSVFDASLDSIPFSDYLPATGRLLGDARGDLWAQVAGLADLAPGDASLQWNVLAPDGSWLGRVTLPARFSVQEIGADYLLGVWLPGTGPGPHIRLYRLTTPAGGS